MTPFQALHGYIASQVNLDNTALENSTARRWWQDRQGLNNLLKENLEIAQNRMKQNADKSRLERSFEVGESVYLKLQPYRQNSVALRRNLKLSSK